MRGRQAAMLLSPPAWQGAGWILCTLSMKPACSCHACLLIMYCAQSGTTSHPQRCWQPSPAALSLGESQTTASPSFRDTGKWGICASTVYPPSSSSTSAVGYRKGACLSRASSVYMFPFRGWGGEAKKPNRSQEALRERRAYYKSRQNQQERACWAERCPLTPRPCPQGGGDTVPLSPVLSHLLSSVISSKLAIVE